MNAQLISQENSQPQPRFDRKFIEEHRLVERYLEGRLPYKGARELEQWCGAHPEYLDELKLSERVQASLQLLEAAGRSQDLGEPKPPWWKSVYVLLGLGAAALLSLLAFWVLLGKFTTLRGELDDTRTLMARGSLVQPATSSVIRVTPDRAPNLDRERIVVDRSAPQLMDLHVDLGYTPLMQFRLFVDKEEQGRALVLNDLLKDSNGELRMTLNSTGLAAGIYKVRIEGLPFRGDPLPLGWLILEVR
jgi:hypothetical protein